MAHETTFLDSLPLEGTVSRDDPDRDEHAGDYGTPDDVARTPDAVVFAESTDDVAAVLAGANERGVPVTPYAAGTGLEANAAPVDGGISLDLTRMDAIGEVRPADRQVDVEAGVIGGDLNEALARHGLFAPAFPSSADISTIGGMLATDASGMKTVRYGEVADWVLELEVVLADGTVTTVGSRAVKTSSGYNLLDLFVGSEGTLGVITRATFELAGRPAEVRGGRAVFPTLGDATRAIADAIAAGVDVAKLELVDDVTAAIANAYADERLPEKPMAFFEFHADHDIEADVEYCRTVFADHDVESFEVASGREMADLWQVRKDVLYAAEAYDPDLDIGETGDVTVPIGRYPDLIAAVREVGEEYGFTIPCFGHAGDGNLHYFVLADYDDPAEAARAKQAYAAIVERAIDLDGTATGEHGVGVGKREFMPLEHDAGALEAMACIKDALDPKGILNPSKVLPGTEQ